MNETCSKCGGPLDPDGYCTYHQSRPQQRNTPARQSHTTVPSYTAIEIVDQSSSDTPGLLGFVLGLAFLVAISFDLLGGTFEIFPVSFPMLIFLQIVKLFTGVSLVVIWWKRDRPIITILWFVNLIFAAVHLFVLLWE